MHISLFLLEIELISQLTHRVGLQVKFLYLNYMAMSPWEEMPLEM